MKRLPLFLSLAVSALAADPVELFTGKDLAGWKPPMGTWSAVASLTLDPANPKAFLAQPGTGILLNSTGGKTVNAISEGEYGDCELHVEFCVPQGANSGVYLQGRYEVQVLDSFGKATVDEHDCGAIYERWLEKEKKGYEGHPPRVNASKRPGEWQSFDITFRAPRFAADGKKTENAKFVKVVHNGEVIHENVEVTGPTRGGKPEEKPTGPIVLQGDHGPVAYRNLKLTPQ
jgi:hypothetical protein